jgi:predicted CopG family antitoxin
MSDELERKNVQMSLDVYETLLGLKHGNMTFNDVLIEVLNKARIPIVKL